MSEDPGAPKDAAPATRAANEAVAPRLPLDDRRDFALAERGRIAPPASAR